MNVKLLKSVMVLNGDTIASLAEALGISRRALSYKLNDPNAEFRQNEIIAIKRRYNLSASEIDYIFFSLEVSK